MHFIIVLTSLTTTHEAQSPIGGGSNPLAIHSIPITTERLLVGFWVFLPRPVSALWCCVHQLGKA